MEINVSSNIKDVSTDNFMIDVIEASKDKPIIVDFWAPWCEPCKQLGPLLENAVKEQKEKITLVKIDIEQNQEIAAQLRIQSIPTVYTFFEGKVVDGFQGAKTNSEILDFVKKSAGLSGPGAEVENLISMVKLSIEERNWNVSNEVSQKILTLDPENHIGFASLIKSMIGLNQFKDVKEIVEALAIEIKESKPVTEALMSLEPSEKAYKAQENIKELEQKLEKDPNNLDSILEMAIALYGKGEIAKSFDLLLKSIEIDREWNDQSARKQLLEFFTSAGFEAVETINARRKLASLLFS
ncbi:thioredoxin [Alphaproteobacteria bacterium]|nr:thioredoxin [Alphaproteobacteria bacterium]MDC1023174.1 thioredoxin [Alphaproteobacteria bacterium]